MANQKATTLGSQPAALSRKGSKQKLKNLAETLVSLMVIAVWFTAILLLAAGLGWVIEYAHEHFTWMPGWMFELGHLVEDGLFVGDCISLVWAVGEELWDDVLHKPFSAAARLVQSQRVKVK